MSGHDGALPNPRGVKLTYDDFVLSPDDGLRHELIGWLAPFDVVLSPSDVVEPDLLYMSNERKAQVLTSANVQGPPELVVEVGSPSTRRRDETIKRALYERAGVTEYWVVDTELNAVRVYRRLGDRFTRPEQLSLEAGDVLTTALLPGLELPLSDIFRM